MKNFGKKQEKNVLNEFNRNFLGSINIFMGVKEEYKYLFNKI